MIRTLNQQERADLSPFLAEYQEARAAFQRASDQLARVLRLVEPQSVASDVRFDPETMSFVQEAAQQE